MWRRGLGFRLGVVLGFRMLKVLTSSFKLDVERLAVPLVMFSLPRSGFWHARESLWSFERGCPHYNQETPARRVPFFWKGEKARLASEPFSPGIYLAE